MALQVWLPFNKDTHNQGIFDKSPAFSASNCSIIDSGKLSKCLKTTTSGNIDTYYTPKFNVSSISFGGWFKFNKEEIQNAIGGLNYTSSAVAATGNLIGNCSYGGIGLIWISNNMYSSGKVLSSINVFGNIRTPSINYNTNQITINFDEWIHIFYVLNRDKNEMYLYKNGELFNTVHLNSYSDWVERYLQINRGGIYGGNGPAACIPYCINDLRIYDHALTVKEVKEISKGLVVHYQLKDTTIEATTNLCTNLVAGGRTTLSADKMSVTTNGTEGDTYFDMALSETLVSGTTYTLSMYATGMPEGKEWIMRIGNLSQYLFSIYNGYNKITFTANDSLVTSVNNRGTKLLIDDGGGEARYAVTTFSHCQLEKKAYASPYTIGTRPANNVIYDCSGFNNNGTIWKYDSNGTCEIDATSPRYYIDTYINSSNNTTNTASGTVYIYGNCELTSPEKLTVAFWCKPIAGYGGNTTQGQFSLTNNSIGDTAGQDYNTAPMNHRDGTIDINSVATVTTIRPNIDFTANEWHYYVVTYDGRYGKVYKDGALTATKDMGSNKNLGNMKGIVIGFSRAGGVWRSNKSYYSDFRLYVTALSDDDIKELYQTAAHVDSNNFYTYEFVEG